MESMLACAGAHGEIIAARLICYYGLGMRSAWRCRC